MPRAFTEVESSAIRARLLAAGRRGLARGAAHKIAVEALAREAGISKGAFYRFFESKEALYLALLAEAEGAIREKIRSELADPAPHRLGRVLDTIFRSVVDDPVLRLLADPAEAAQLFRALPPEALTDARSDDDAFFSEVWRALVDAGDAADDVPAELFAALPVAALGIAQQRSLLGDARADALERLILESLTARLGRDVQRGR